MSRLFVTPKEAAFISDITKELIKDIVGQAVNYYSISEIKTKTNIYNEALQKHYDGPINIDALVDVPENVTNIDRFGVDQTYSVNVFFHWQDLIDKGINVNVGDIFQFGANFYEIMTAEQQQNVFGEVENKIGLKCTAKKVRDGVFNSQLVAPTDVAYQNGVQNTFVQQRGQANNSLGPTNDVRALKQAGTVQDVANPAEVSQKGAGTDGKSSFYDD